MQKYINRLSNALITVLEKPKFFVFTIILFVFESAWIALSNTYPLPFDEYYHFGQIDLYSHYWLPFISHQPDYAGVYGDVTRNGSYLYHYLMSFPYRIISLFTDSFVAKVIIFRFINIALFCVGLYIFRKLLMKLGLSARLSNLTILFFVLVPIVPLLAAQSNYDNLLMILIPSILLLAAKVLEQKKVDAKNVILLFSLCMITGIVKYTFLPIFLAISVFIVMTIIYRRRSKMFADLRKSFKALSIHWRISLTLLLAVSGFLFSERYLVNIVRYNNPQPDCIAVQSYETCAQYSPWIRNQLYKDRYRANEIEGPFGFTKIWAPKMINDAFIAFTYIRVDPVGIRSQLGDIKTKEALSIPKAAAKIIFVAGSVLVVLNFGKLWNDSRWRMIFITILFYTSVLWFLNFSEYTRLRHIVAIQPRYLVIFAPLIMGAIAQAYSSAIKSKKMKAALASVALLALLQGGGASIYILRSYSIWYWPNSTVVWINSRARDVLYKITIVR